MNFLTPRFKNKEKVEYRISHRTRLIIEYYAKYAGYSEDEVIDIFMENILLDKEFVEWLNKRRSRGKIDEIIFGNESTGSD
jgi:DNA primase large subunit